MARGCLNRGKRRLVCDIDEDVFEEINAADIPGATSTSAKIRVLIEWGLEALQTGEGKG